MTKMTFADGDDWGGVYMDNVLVSEGHSISAFDAVVLAIEHKVRGAVRWSVDAKWLEDRGDLPSDINEVKWAGPHTAPTQVGAA